MGYIFKGIKVTESQISDMVILSLQSGESINMAMVSIRGITSTHHQASSMICIFYSTCFGAI